MLLEMRKTWISSPKFDLSFIIIPPLLGVLVAVLLESPDPVLTAIRNQLIVVLVIIDLAHLISMWFRIYTSGEEGPQELKKYWAIYFLLVITFFGLAMFNYFGKMYWVVTYFAMYHNVKQNYGFYSYYRKNESKDPKEIKFEKYYFMAVSFFPIYLWHLDKKDFINYWSGYFFEIPYLEYTKYPVIIAMLYYTFKYVQLSYKKYLNDDLSPTKILFFVTVTLAWYLTILIVRETLSLFLAIIAAHAIAYLFFVWKLYDNHLEEKVREFGRNFKHR
jgi:hypothetical protein